MTREYYRKPDGIFLYFFWPPGTAPGPLITYNTRATRTTGTITITGLLRNIQQRNFKWNGHSLKTTKSYAKYTQFTTQQFILTVDLAKQPFPSPLSSVYSSLAAKFMPCLSFKKTCRAFTSHVQQLIATKILKRGRDSFDCFFPLCDWTCPAAIAKKQDWAP